ncbi:MAG: tetratricopeptide repeat protein [Phycisphaerales bacterium]|nr:tetratricopeptide repeat protein [Planctomycetota bacterium]MCH8507689.1 tetratricopeptide repeat protein [Phycisphaerales bacterium]
MIAKLLSRFRRDPTPTHTGRAFSDLVKQLIEDKGVRPAIKTLEAHRQAVPHDREGLCNGAIHLSEAGRPDLAAGVLRELAERFPDDWLVVLNLAVACDLADDLENAAEYADRATELEPDEPESWRVCGNIYRQLGDPEKTRRRFERLCELAPDDPGNWYDLGTSLLDLGRWEDAERSCRRALEIRPDHATAMSNLGAALVLQERYDEAEPIILDTLGLIPNDGVTICNLARIYESRGRTAEALELYRRALRDDPEYRRAQEDIDRLEAEHPDT